MYSYHKTRKYCDIFKNKLNEIRLDQESLDKSTTKSRTQKENVLVQLEKQ